MSVIEGKNPTSLRMKFDLGKDELTNKIEVVRIENTTLA